MLNVRRKKKLKLILAGIFLESLWLVHNWLSNWWGIEVKNVGVSFGWNSEILIVFNLVLLCWVTWYWWRNNYWSLNFILVGGWINAIDRLIFGYVRDYWSLGTVYNNIADWLISVGVGIFILELWKKK